VLTLGVAAGCSGGGAQWNTPGGAPGGGTSAPPGESAFAVNPAADAKNVSPADPVSVSITNGVLNDVLLTNAQNKQVKGEFSADKSSWTTTEELGYDKKYTLKASGNGLDGKTYEDTRSFTTVRPGNYTMPYLRANVGQLLDGGTFGVGQPVVVWFDEPIKDKAEAERSLTVTTDPAGIVGAWRWVNGQELHWRPKEYWPSGTKVTVDAKVYGKNFGDGLYGQEDRSASFTIGKKKIAIADGKTKHMKVYIDDKLVTKINGRDTTNGIPISMGKGGTETGANGQTISFTTNSGPHVVTQKFQEYRMTSASFGITDKDSPNYYDERIKKSIRISGDGEFVHLADWNIWAHGKQNTSHGCINVAPAYIYWFYDQFGAGDIVDVTGTSRKLDWRNGLGDWVLSWEEWQKGSAL
jgi:lipoprotein-anchoring transpeptidase ErfK/SrfK